MRTSLQPGEAPQKRACESCPSLSGHSSTEMQAFRHKGEQPGRLPSRAMRRIVFALALLLTVSLSAQTADEIINKYLQTVGGLDRSQAVKSLRRTGKFTGGGGFEAPILELNKRPNLVRQEFTIQGFTGVNGYEGKNGWKFEPFGGKKGIES